MDSTSIVYILEKTVSSVKEELQMAQQYLEQASEHNFSEFMNSLSEVIKNGQNSPVVRMQAGLQLKNALYSKDSEKLQKNYERWTSIPIDVRNQIKKNVVETLGTETVRPSSAAQCVAYIACIDLPENRWPDVITTLTSNVTTMGSTEMMKESSLESIGYICQDIDPSILTTQSNTILTAIVHGMKKEETSTNVKLAATNALFNSLEFTKANFDMESERHFIMQVVCEATQCTTINVKVSALQCLVKIMSLYYQYMEHYMGPALFAISMEAMKSDSDEVALQGIEFWSNVCDEEVDLSIELTEAVEENRQPVGLSKFYAKGALCYLLPILTETLSKQDESDDEEDWNPYKAAGVCLVLLANCCGDDVVSHIISFVSQNITSQNWKYRDAAVMAFGSIIEGPSTTVLLPLATQAMPTMIELLSDQSVEVRDTTAWALGRMCEIIPEAILNSETIEPLLMSFINGLDSVPRVAANVCWAFSSIAEAAYNAIELNDDGSEPETYCLSRYYEPIVQKLLETTDRQDANQKNLRSAAYEALMELIKNSPTDCYISVQKTTMVILDRLERVIDLEVSINTQSDRHQYNDLQSSLCATLQIVLRKVKPDDAPMISDNVMKALLRMLSSKQSAGVHEDALHAISSLIEVMGDGFKKYVSSLQPFLMSSLNHFLEQQVCIVAIGMVSDLCRAINHSMMTYSDEIMTVFIEILGNPSVSNKVKPPILSAFGDIALALGPHFVKYLDVVLTTLQKVPLEVADRNDYDQIDYLNELREACLDSYTGILQGLKNDSHNNDIKLLIPYVNDMLKFLGHISSTQFDISDSVIAASSGLIGDLMMVFRNEIVEKIDADFIHVILLRARKSKLQKTRQIGIWAQKEIKKTKLNKV